MASSQHKASGSLWCRRRKMPPGPLAWRSAYPSAASPARWRGIHGRVTGTPERLSLPVLAALCDALDVTPAELIATRAQNAARRKAAAGSGPAAAGAGGVRSAAPAAALGPWACIA
jgi:hypothetical protein